MLGIIAGSGTIKKPTTVSSSGLCARPAGLDQKLTCGMFSVQFLRALSFHLRLARGPRGGILLRGDALDLKTLSFDPSTAVVE